jgi:hypothetical protein
VSKVNLGHAANLVHGKSLILNAVSKVSKVSKVEPPRVCRARAREGQKIAPAPLSPAEDGTPMALRLCLSTLDTLDTLDRASGNNGLSVSKVALS